MPGPHPAVAALRVAVRREVADCAPDGLVLAAVSGGPDSLALAAALAFVGPRAGLRAGALVVDHGLQPGSAGVARAAARQCRLLGLEPVEVLTVEVPAGPGSGGPEAAARDARLAALESAAARGGAAAVLLGHTRDDQAETVLLGLARGSGARSLAGMPRRRGPFRRPLLGLPRETTRRACVALGLDVVSDPDNADPAFARARLRDAALPALEKALGPGVTAALARTAAQLRADADALDALAADAAEHVTAGDGSLDCAGLAALPAALRARVLREAARAAGCPPGSLGHVHADALDALVGRWHGQGPVALPGGVSGVRRYGRLRLLGPR
jgi:tRNA(Ile)-lysidine synthase